MKNKTNIRMQRDIFSGDIAVQVVQELSDGFYVARPPVMDKLDEGMFAPAFMQITPTEAQQMIDELWNCGLRPSEGTGSAGSLAATEKHLSDMRKLAFKVLKIDV